MFAPYPISFLQVWAFLGIASSSSAVLLRSRFATSTEAGAKRDGCSRSGLRCSRSASRGRLRTRQATLSALVRRPARWTAAVLVAAARRHGDRPVRCAARDDWGRTGASSRARAPTISWSAAAPSPSSAIRSISGCCCSCSSIAVALGTLAAAARRHAALSCAARPSASAIEDEACCEQQFGEEHARLSCATSRPSFR